MKKSISLIIALTLSLLMLASIGSLVQAEDDSAEVELTVVIVEPEPPTVTTETATSIGTTTATLNGVLTDLMGRSVDVSFEWGKTSAYGNETTSETMTATGVFSSSLSGLLSGTKYHFRAKAVGGSTGYGADRAFTTSYGGGVLPTVEGPTLGTTDVSGMVGDGCRFIEPATAVSDDESCTLTVPVGTVGLTEDLECLPEITMVTMDDPPPPPEAAHVIGLVYNFGPDGATFDPPIILTFTYDPDSIPEGVSEEDLVIAYFVDGEWIELECVIDTETNTITASVSHFTTFAVIGAPPTVVEEEPTVVEEEPVVVEKEEVPPVAEVEEEPVVEEEEEPAVEEVEPVVEEEVEVTPDLPAAGVNWPLIGWIIGVVVVVVGWLGFLFWRRRVQLTRQ